jgi:glycosyltransferase involved in cell wall biosynthesis
VKRCRFSVIIPAYNSGEYIGRAVDSVLNQDYDDYEIIVVDDGSEDDTCEVVKKYFWSDKVHLYRTEINGGPGIARNVGIKAANGEYLLFLDSDDVLVQHLLNELDIKLHSAGEPDIYGFNYGVMCDNPDIGRRYDIDYLNLRKSDLLYHYLCMHMIGMVICNTYKHSLIQHNNLTFRGGYHEDVDFAYKAFYYADIVVGDTMIGYVKDNREGSIVNTISSKHIEGFFDAYSEIRKLIPPGLERAYEKGLLNLSVFKIKDVLLLQDKKRSMQMYRLIYDRYKAAEHFDFTDDNILRSTSYEKLMEDFLDMSEKEIQLEEMENRLNTDLKRTWGCWELFNSVFLDPDEIRTCCKRFFVDGERRGDISLFKTSSSKSILSDIIQSKRKLYNAINQAEKTACDGCPYLTFQDWTQEQNFLEIKKISFEYHTCCNLRCEYCSEQFYGGKKPDYHVDELLDEMIEKGCLDKCESIIWGGGEPTLDPKFEYMITQAAKVKNRGTQRVITNATVYSQTIDRLLNENKISIVTSIDSGCPETFKKIRGADMYNRVIDNLKRYSSVNPSDIIVKYIIRDDNCSPSEIEGFVKSIAESSILSCNFQISCDFKMEYATDEMMVATIYMYCLLRKAGALCVYLDELARERIICNERVLDRCRELVKDVEQYVVYKPIDNEYSICGNSIQILHILNNSMLAKNTNTDYILVAGHASYNHSLCAGKILKPLESLRDDNTRIIIAASQGTDALIKRITAIGIDASRIVDKLVI